MSIIKLYTEDADPGVTLISNVFIDYYLKDANDAQLKVYLYLVRHITNHRPFDISNIADEYNHTEADVIRSLKYWEQKQLITLDYDSSNNIVGIELLKVEEASLSHKGELHMFPVPNEKNDDRKVEISGNENEYSPSKIAEMAKTDSDWVSVKTVVESYLNKTLSMKDLQILAHIYKDLGFTPADVDRLMDRCLTNGKLTMRSIKKVAEEEFLTERITPSIKAIMDALGNGSTPTSDELDFINSWLSYMNLELILEGCRKAALSTTGNRFKYANGIFKNWKLNNITSIEDVAKQEEDFRQSKEAPKKTVACKASKQNSFKQYTQTPYEWDEINRELGIK